MKAKRYVRVCAWCQWVVDHNNQKWRPLTPGQLKDLGKRISHGVCLDCYANNRKELERYRAERIGA